MRTWVEINLTALWHNYQQLQQYLPEKTLIPVVKANAYGHGIAEVTRFLAQQGVTHFAVANASEAQAVKTIEQPTIFLLSSLLATEKKQCDNQRWIVPIASIKEWQYYQKIASKEQPVLAHITIDTGMGRGGVLVNELIAWVKENLLQHRADFQLVSIGSHFAAADNDTVMTQQQLALFQDAIGQLAELGWEFTYRHISNSMGICYADKVSNCFRPGIALYGVTPKSDNNYPLALRPVMRLYARIIIIRQLPAGSTISYGSLTTLSRDTTVATISCGYGDGYPRFLPSNQKSVLVAGKLAPLLGVVTMDQCMVDVTDIVCQEGDRVELFGEQLLLQDLVQNSPYITWQVLTGITVRVPRIYREDK